MTFLFTDWDEEQAQTQIAKTAKQRIRLRPYQLEAVDSVYDEWRTVRSTMLNMATGLGKSVCFAETMRRWDIASQGKILLIAHRRELILQAIGHAMRAGLSSGIEMAGKHATGEEDVIIASVQTLNATRKCRVCFGEGCDECFDGKVKRFTRFNPRDFGMVVVDEAHHSTAVSYRAVMKWFEQNPLQKTLMVTATPKRADKVGLHNVCQSIAYTMELRKAIDEGWLVPIKQKFVTVEGLDISKVEVRAGKLNEGQVEAAFLGTDEDEERLLHSIVKPTIDEAAGRKTLVFAAGKDHANKLAACFAAHGVEAGVVVEDTDPAERAELISRYSNGDLQVLVNCMVFCLDEQTEILTRQGWVGPDQITNDHEVANWDNGYVYFAKPKRIVDRNTVDGERFYSIEGPKRSIRVTGRHRIVYAERRGRKWQKAPVESLVGKNFVVPLCGIADTESIKLTQRTEKPNPKRFAAQVRANSYHLRKGGMKPEEAVRIAKERINRRYGLRDLDPCELTLDHCRFIGYWMGDGCRSILKSGGVEYTLCQSTSQPGVVKWVDNLIARCGFDSIRRVKDRDDLKEPVVVWSLPRGTGFGEQERRGLYSIEQYLDKLGADCLWGLNVEQFGAFIEGLWMADGDHGRNGIQVKNTLSISNTEKEMFDLVQAIAVVRGWAATLKPRKKKNESHRTLWTLTLRKNSIYSVSSSSGNGFVEEELSTGERAWCVETHTKNIITRRNGFVTVMGNTEGFDAPATEIITNCRPTKSESLYLQIIGRATRPLAGVVDGPETAEDRKAAIADSDKDSCTILDFVGNSGDIKLISVVDVLAGDRIEPIDLAEAVRVATKSGETVDIEELAEKMKQARLEEKERKEVERRQRLLTKTKADRADYSVVDVDLFGGPTFESDGKYVEPITKGQQGFLYHQLGMKRKETKNLSKKQASGIIGKVFKQAGDDWKRLIKEAGSVKELQQVGKAIEARKSSDYLMRDERLVDSLRAAYRARKKELGE